MKKILRNSVIGLALSGLFVTGGCTDLNETVYDQLTEDNLDLTGERELAQLLGAAVTNYRYLVADWFGMWYLLEESSDEFVTPKRLGIGWGDTYINLHKHDWGPEVGQIDNSWTFPFIGINYCNRVLSNMPDTEEMKNSRAHVRFFRAMYYYHLIDVFGNVPIMPEEEQPTGWLPELAGIEAVYDYTVNEFQQIKDDFNDQKPFGYGNKYACCMALAKMYMMKEAWLGEPAWQEALDELEIIVKEGGYSLSSDYLEPFRENISGCPEVIFAVPQDRTHTAQWTMQSYCFPQTGLDAYGSSAPGYNGSNAIPQFIKSYAQTDKRLRMTWAYGPQYYAKKNDDGSYTPGWKLDESEQEGIPFEADDWSGTGILNYNIECHHVDEPGCYQQEGARLHKYEIPGGTNDGTTATDIVIFRYTDALMMKAECLLRLGKDKQTAADIVTQIRRRAFDSGIDATRSVADLEGPSVYQYGLDNYPVEGHNVWSTHEYTQEGGSDIVLGGLLDDLGWEFAGEMHRRQDLIRFKMTDGRNVWNGKSWFCKKATTEDKWNFFPIPKSAMDANIKLKQTYY